MGFSSLTRDGTWAPLHWEHRVLATGPPGESPVVIIMIVKRFVVGVLRQLRKDQVGLRTLCPAEGRFLPS